MSVSIASPSANSIRSTPRLPWIAFVDLPRCTRTPSASIFLHEHPRAGVVDLPRHESRRELDDVRLQPEVIRRLGRFEPQQAAADHRAPLRLRGVVDDPLKIVDRAIDKNARQLDARHRRHERIRAGRQHDVVVVDLDAFVGADNALLAVDRVGPIAEVQLDAVLRVPFLPRQHQLFGVAMGEERREADAVVGGPRLLAKRDDADSAARCRTRRAARKIAGRPCRCR